MMESPPIFEYLRTKVLPNILKNLLKSDGTPYNLYTDGLKITTTLDSKMQTFGGRCVQAYVMVTVRVLQTLERI